MRVLPVGRRALLLDDLDDVAAWQVAITGLVTAGRLAPDDLVPGARTLLLDGVDVPEATALVRGLIEPRAVTGAAAGPLVQVPVVYDGADLPEVARVWGVDEAEVVARHTGTEFRVAFCGFAPGFPYLLGLDERVPRRASPRPSVPAGSVGLADRWCGIYPTASPGGWQLLGRTDLALFDPDREPPALLPPGTRVRFVAVHEAGPPRLVARPAMARSPRALTVVRPGALTTVQDAGRRGAAYLGVPRAGALDVAAARLANRLVGNPPGAALLETTVDGVALRAGTAVTVAVTGAPADVRAGDRPGSWGVAQGVLAGEVLDVGPALAGVRSYVAIAGGVDVPAVLGSRASDTLAGLGPAPLAVGDLLPLGTPSGPPPDVEFTVPAAGRVVLRVRPGPRADWLGPDGLAALLAGPYILSPLSNRVGARLTGPGVPRADGELDSEGMVLGAVQLPPDGQPVVMLADHPTTGGYPVVAVVDPRDLDALAQARPGDAVHLVPADPVDSRSGP